MSSRTKMIIGFHPTLFPEALCSLASGLARQSIGAGDRAGLDRFHEFFASHARLGDLATPDLPQDKEVKVEPDPGRGNGDRKSMRTQAERIRPLTP
jgi:hypothetical protein